MLDAVSTLATVVGTTLDAGALRVDGLAPNKRCVMGQVTFEPTTATDIMIRIVRVRGAVEDVFATATSHGSAASRTVLGFYCPIPVVRDDRIRVDVRSDGAANAAIVAGDPNTFLDAPSI